MLTWIICAILAVLGVMVSERKSKPGLSAYFVTGLIGIVFGLIVSLVLGALVPEQFVYRSTTKLASLRSNDGVRGSFWLGSGHIGTTPYYFFYKEAGGGYQPGQVAVENYNVTVIEEGRTDGELRTYVTECSRSMRWFVICGEPRVRYEFHVPEGSLKRGFAVQ